MCSMMDRFCPLVRQDGGEVCIKCCLLMMLTHVLCRVFTFESRYLFSLQDREILSLHWPYLLLRETCSCLDSGNSFTHTHTHTHLHTYHNHGLASQVYASSTFPFPLAFGRRRGSLRRRQRRGVAPLRQRLHGLDKPCVMARNKRGPPLSSNHEWQRGQRLEIAC